MKKLNKILCRTLILILFSYSAQAQNKILSIGKDDAKVTVKVFSSLTCPHCASFHKIIFSGLIKTINRNIISI